MVYDLRAYWLVYPLLLKTEREEKERQMLFKMYNPWACDEVCGSAVCLSSPSNNLWQLHSASAAHNLFTFNFPLCRRALLPFLLIPSDKKKNQTTAGMTAQTDVVQLRTRRQLIVAFMSLHLPSMCLCLTEVSLPSLTAAKIDGGYAS